LYELENLRRVLEKAEAPLSSAKLSKLLQQKSGKVFKPVLDAEAKAGRIYKWAADLYWDKNPTEMARERLLTIAASEMLPGPKLNALAAAESPKIGLSLVRNARTELLKENLLREVGKAKLNVNAQHPQQYLELEIGRLLSEFGIERAKESIRALLGATEAKAEIPEVAEKIFKAMNRIAFAPGTSVTFYRLRQQPELAHIPKLVFDQAALRLQQERKVFLAGHGHALSLPKPEQDELVTDGLGAYYVSICAL
jgi:hypothetical protein